MDVDCASDMEIICTKSHGHSLFFLHLAYSQRWKGWKGWKEIRGVAKAFLTSK